MAASSSSLLWLHPADTDVKQRRRHDGHVRHEWCTCVSSAGVWADVDVTSAAWISMRTKGREHLPLKPLCLQDIRARPEAKGQMRISNCPWLRSLLHQYIHTENSARVGVCYSSVFSPTCISICLCCFSIQRQRRDSSCLSLKSNHSQGRIIHFKGGHRSAHQT